MRNILFNFQFFLSSEQKMLLLINNPCYWKKEFCCVVIFQLIFALLSPMINVCVAMKDEVTREIVANDDATAVNSVEEKGQKSETITRKYSFWQLAAVARADKRALLTRFSHLKKDMDGNEIQHLKDVDELLVVKNLVTDVTGIIKSGGAGYSDELKAVISWIEFWPYLLNPTWNDNEHWGQIVRSMAVRPAVRRHSADGPVAGNDVVKMVEMLKRNNSKSTNRTARKRDFLINKFSQNKEEQPVSPFPGGISDNSDDDDMEWKNRGVCMLVGKLVKSLAKVEYEQPFIDLLKDIYEHHKDVLAGKSENLKENLQNQMKELIRGKVQVVKDKLVHLKNKVKQPKILVKAVVEKAKDTVKERGKREG